MSLGISIIIPLFNKASYIGQVLNSFINQMTELDEIIVVDDMSTDNGADIVHELFFAIPNQSKIISSFSNAGPATARNLGAKVSGSSYLLFFDADDIPRPHLLSELKRAILKFPHQHLFTYGITFEANNRGASNNNEIEQFESISLLRERHSFAKESLIGNTLCTASSTCVSAKAFIEVGGFQNGLRYCEDPELWVRLSANYDIVQIQAMLATYRDVQCSLSYQMRGRSGAANAYINTLLELHATYDEKIYLLLARFTILKNFIFSRLGGEPAFVIRSYLRYRRQQLGSILFWALMIASYSPIFLVRFGVHALRCLKNILISNWQLPADSEFSTRDAL